MSAKAKSRKRSKRLLSNDRPAFPTRGHKTTSLSSKVTRTLIRSHHTLHKRLKQAETAGEIARANEIRLQIETQGGLAKYQQASIQGQSSQRGGDSSKLLIEWLQELGLSTTEHTKLRLLEVGALRVDNACSRCGIFDVVRIDLNSQHEQILQQDFMTRPMPVDEADREENGFDVISLSLVLNYIPDPVGRGEMLKIVASFLRRALQNEQLNTFPGLYLVLPRPCITNSRYLDEAMLEAMMSSLGYVMTRTKLSSKLAYYYFRYVWDQPTVSQAFTKKELRKASNMNNFAIVLQ
ncbi:MAG: hypothetical protein GOMPHAMPRED_003847 [Gomphillus americanus]|uniref:25S rRNA adenine-N(1) methyltransferase n=1 Tax=Gomphillus americanus TaxID=1940652 RepID=A0A8H3FIN6_9LECA|nr:MAG: hypothetical protein GOMPHAMPRED_003847 [Gomphillus americanus]